MQHAARLRRSLGQYGAEIRRRRGKLGSQPSVIECGIVLQLDQVLLLGFQRTASLLLLAESGEQRRRSVTLLNGCDHVRFLGVHSSNLLLKLPAALTIGLGIVAEALQSPIDRRPKNSVGQGLDDGRHDRLKESGRRIRADRSFRSGASDLR